MLNIMQRYVCEHCHNLECETSICPVCGSRTKPLKSEVYWCNHCNAPSYNSVCDLCGSTCHYIATDIRPVFPEERLLLEVLLETPMKYCNDAVFSSGGGNYFVNGKKIKVDLIKESKKDPQYIIQQLARYYYDNSKYSENIYNLPGIQNFIKINAIHLNTIVQEASDFIRQQAGNLESDSMFVSFSGGKDSTVTSNLVLNALGKDEIIHIYGDTTLEYPESRKYINRFRISHPRVPMITAKNRDQDFFDLCDKLGPPSRLLRWCCTVFKTGAITKTIEMLFGEKTRIIAFHGIRRAESTSRSKYERVSISPKITKQIVCQPIIDWLDFDVWLYILAYSLDFNEAYRLGFSRVGCWCCPNNTEWAEFLSSIYMNQEYIKFKNQLYSFAKQVGKPDWKAYIDSGNWKSRQGGNGLEYGKNTLLQYKPCVLEDNSYSYELNRVIDDHLYNLFVPFGIIDYTLGNPRLGEVFVLDRKTNIPLLKFTGKKGQNKLRITVLNYEGPFKRKQYVENLVNAQLTKFQMCIGCSACSSVCRCSAITVENTAPGLVSIDSIYYHINPDKCIGCLECVLHFDTGCYMKKVLRMSNDR